MAAAKGGGEGRRVSLQSTAAGCASPRLCSRQVREPARAGADVSAEELGGGCCSYAAATGASARRSRRCRCGGRGRAAARRHPVAQRGNGSRCVVSRWRLCRWPLQRSAADTVSTRRKTRGLWAQDAVLSAAPRGEGRTRKARATTVRLSPTASPSASDPVPEAQKEKGRETRDGISCEGTRSHAARRARAVLGAHAQQRHAPPRCADASAHSKQQRTSERPRLRAPASASRCFVSAFGCASCSPGSRVGAGQRERRARRRCDSGSRLADEDAAQLGALEGARDRRQAHHAACRRAPAGAERREHAAADAAGASARVGMCVSARLARLRTGAARPARRRKLLRRRQPLRGDAWPSRCRERGARHWHFKRGAPEDDAAALTTGRVEQRVRASM